MKSTKNQVVVDLKTLKIVPPDELFWDANVNIEHIVWLPSCAASAPDTLEDMLDTWPDEIAAAIGCPVNDVEDAEAFMEWCGLNNKYGFLVEAKTPVDFSWGHCQLGWFYTDSLDVQFIERLEKWRGTVCKSSVPGCNEEHLVAPLSPESGVSAVTKEEK